MFSPISRRHLSVLLISILLSAAVFAGITAADTTEGDFPVNETQMNLPPEGEAGMDGGPVPPENSTMPFDNRTMPLDNSTPETGFNTAIPPDGFTEPTTQSTETAESPVPALGILAGVCGAVFFLTRKT